MTVWTVACPTPLSMGFPRQEYCSGVQGPPLGDLPDPGTELASPVLAGGFFTAEPPGKPLTGMSPCDLAQQPYEQGLCLRRSRSARSVELQMHKFSSQTEDPSQEAMVALSLVSPPSSLPNPDVEHRTPHTRAGWRLGQDKGEASSKPGCNI